MTASNKHVLQSKISLIAFGAALFPALAFGQTDGLFISEIVVTAQKREQRLQDVPISITAVTGEEIKGRGVTSLEDMQYTVPGLSSLRYGPATVEYIQLRGVATSVGSPTVGAYLDEMPVTGDAQGATLDIRLLDIERVEVLRGPQATLYGENSMGGTIRYITASPKLDRFEGSAEGEIGSIEDGGWSYRANAVVNAPIIDEKVGLRVVGGYEKQSGWIDKPALGDRDANGASVYMVRGKLDMTLGENGLLSLLALHQESDQDNMSFGIRRISAAQVDQYNFDNYEVYQATLQYDLGGVDLTATTGYLERDNRTQLDFTSYFLPVLQAPPPFGLGLPGGFITEIAGPSVSEFKSFSNEIRLSSPDESTFHWMIGGYMRNTRGHVAANFITAPGALPLTLLSATNETKSDAWSVFGEVSYDFTDTLSLLGGLRYYRDRRQFVSENITFGAPALDVGRAYFDTLNPRVSLSFTPSRTSTFYANISKGFRSGGFNQTSSGPNVPPTYVPDSIWTYEVGAKQQFFDHRLNFEAAVYYNDWKNVQSPFLLPGTATLITTSGGKVRGFGVDLAVSGNPVAGLTLAATYGWNNLENKIATADKDVGDPTDFAAKESWSISADYRAALFGRTEGFLRADYQHVGKSQVTTRSIGQIAQFPKRDMVNMRAGIDFEQYQLSAFVTNLFDTKTPIAVPFGAFSENTEMQPRTIGINVKVQY